MEGYGMTHPWTIKGLFYHWTRFSGNHRNLYIIQPLDNAIFINSAVMKQNIKQKKYQTRFTLKNIIFLDVTSCSLVEVYLHVG
jgi:hypothetical protein